MPVRKYEVSSWLALRASVLRRAASSSGVAQERRAEFTASLVSEAVELDDLKIFRRVAFGITLLAARNTASNTAKSAQAQQARFAKFASSHCKLPSLLPYTVMANPSLNRTHCGRPSFGL